MSRLKICDFSGQTFKGLEVLWLPTSATKTQLLSSGEFRKLRYDTMPVKSASAKRYFLYQYLKNAKFWDYDTLVKKNVRYLNLLALELFF
jgi:hypothetical protein